MEELQVHDVETGNPRFLNCFIPSSYAKASVGNAYDIHGSVRNQMRECVKQLFNHVRNKLNPRNLNHCFELLGLDFMIDNKGQVGSCFK